MGMDRRAKGYYDVKNGRSPEYDVVALYQNPCRCWSLGLFYLQFPDRAQYNFMLSLTGIGWTENYGTNVVRTILEPPGLGRKDYRGLHRLDPTDGRRLFNLNPAQGLRPDEQISPHECLWFGGSLDYGAAVWPGAEPCFDAGSRPLAASPTGQSLSRGGDFRRAVEACRQEVWEHPSARSYLYLTYVSGTRCLCGVAHKSDYWVGMEHLYLNLTSGSPEELLDPPNVLARMAKEMIQAATRSRPTSRPSWQPGSIRLWLQWYGRNRLHGEKRPDGWWFSVPAEWPW